MRGIILAAAVLFVGHVATANELDQAAPAADQFSAEQIELGKKLPATTVIVVDKKDSTKFTVYHLNERLEPGKKVNFEKLAANVEKISGTLTPGQELEVTKSTQSWGFGWVGPRGGMVAAGGWGGYGMGYGYGGYGMGGYGGYGMGYGGGCFNNCGWYNRAFYNPIFYPTYNYGGYGYNCSPYWGYETASAYVGYVGWGGYGMW